MVAAAPSGGLGTGTPAASTATEGCANPGTAGSQLMSIGTVDSPFPTSMTFTPSKCWVALTRVRLTPVPELSHAVTVTVALACTESVALLAERVAVFGYVPALEASVAELTWTVALAPGERLPKAQESV